MARKSKIGRPKGPDRVPLSLRVTPAVRARLDQRAAATGRSISQEAEFLLERSFERQDLIDEVLRFAIGEGHDHFVVEIRKQGIKTLPALIRAATGQEPIEWLKEMPDYWDEERKAKEKSYEKARRAALSKASKS